MKSPSAFRLLVSAAVLFFPLLNYSQRVEDPEFEKMLGSLLSHSVKEITVRELAEISDKVFLLDVRSKAEFEVSHIPGSIFAADKAFDVQELDSLGAGKEIVIYCSVGYRSERFAADLEKHPGLIVKNLYGGIFEWVNQGNPIVDANGNETENIHAFDKNWGRWLQQGNKVY